VAGAPPGRKRKLGRVLDERVYDRFLADDAALLALADLVLIAGLSFVSA
jgi:hypothetical protein